MNEMNRFQLKASSVMVVGFAIFIFTLNLAQPYYTFLSDAMMFFDSQPTCYGFICAFFNALGFGMIGIMLLAPIILSIQFLCKSFDFIYKKITSRGGFD